MATDKYKNKYRIPSARLQNWDYGTNAPYFVTICTAHREHYFGEIVDTQFIATQLGNIAQQIWIDIPKQFPYTQLGAFVIMPNHVHGIIIINKLDNAKPIIVPIVNPETVTETVPMAGGVTGNKNPMLNDNLSRIIRWYKGRVTFESHKIHADFAWQSRFHDHIIRNDKSYQTITNYINTNVLNWGKDKFHN